MTKDEAEQLSNHLMSYGEELRGNNASCKYASMFFFLSGVVCGNATRIIELEREVDRLKRGVQP